MKKIIIPITLLTIGITNSAVSQGLNNFANLTIESGANLYVKTALNNNAGGTLSNAGTIHASGNFSNTGTPTVESLVILDGAGTQIITGESDFTDVLELNKTGGTATVSSGTTRVHGIMRLAGGNMNANGNLVIASTASGTGLVDDFSSGTYNGVLSGNLRVQRYITGVSGFRYIGAAVSNPPVSELSELGLYGPNGGQIIPQPDCDPNAIEIGSPYGSLFEWREDAILLPTPTAPGDCDQSGWFVRSSGGMQTARGYAAIVSTPTTIEIGGSVGNTQNPAGSPPSVTYGGLTFQADGRSFNGWHAVSNPYPSPIEWVGAPAGFDGQAQFWVSSGSYLGTFQPILPGAGVQIASMQGFYVKKSSVGGAANFAIPQNWRRLGDPTFYKEDLSNTFDIIVRANNFADKTRVRFGDAGETNDFDMMLDANKLMAKGAQPTLMTRLRNENYSINSLSLEDHPMTIPMDLYPGISGDFTFTAEHLDLFNVEAHVYLEDLLEGTIQELTVNPVYSFIANESDDPERFLLHFRLNGEEPMFTGDEVLMYAHDGSAFVFLPEHDGKSQLHVYNALGDLVFETTQLYEGKNSYDLSGLATGAYILRATVNGTPISRKVIL